MFQFLSISFLIIVILSIFILIVWLRAKPTDHGNWRENQLKLPRAMIKGNIVTIDNIRDFRYSQDGKATQLNYICEDYLIDDLEKVWYGISHFAANGVAHTFLSFQFTDNRYLVSSIEARLTPNQKYSPIKGLLRRYSRMMIWGTEPDIIGLRTHIRKEKVLLYPLKLSQAGRVNLFSHFIKDTEETFFSEQYYNTLVDNCVTGILKHSKHWTRWLSYFNPKIVLAGYSDLLAQKYNYIEGDIDLKQLRKIAEIESELTTPEDLDFSKKIRIDWNKT